MISVIIMSVAAALLAAVYLAGRAQTGISWESCEQPWDRLFEILKPAGFLLWSWSEKWQVWQAGRSREELRQRLARLLVKDDVDAEYKNFQIRRFACVWLLAACGLLAGITAETVRIYQSRQEVTDVKRPKAGEGSAVCRLEAEGAWEGRKTAEFSVFPQEYTPQQVEQLFEETYLEALEQLPGENESLDWAEKQLYFKKTGPPGIEMKWTPERWEYVDHSGKIVAEDIPEEGILTSVTLQLSYKEQKTEYQIPCRLMPLDFSVDRQLELELAKSLEEKGKDDPYGEAVILPDVYEGYPLVFYQAVKGGKGLIAVGIGFLSAVLYYFSHAQKLQEKEEERNRQMMADYPDILSKLTVLIGAGFTVRAAWEKIVQNYSRQLERGEGRRRYAYEEMLYASRGIHGGQPELQAYKSFGRRCGLQPYRKLTMLLEQNLKKGGRDLTERLRAETDEAFSVRLHQARREGEKAGTKLMIPMFLMFILVLIMIMVPAAMAL